MRTFWSSMGLTAFAVCMVSGSGCSGRGFLKGKDEWKVPEMSAPTQGMPSSGKGDGNIVQAGGTSPFAQIPSSLSWMTGKTDKGKPSTAPTDIAVAWRNHVDYLPDPVRQGAMTPGLAGQVFLFNSRDQSALADGTITVDLFDETVRPAGQQPNKPERWQFKKDVLKTLRTVDERFGPNYVLFLPWPSYRPDVTRIRITVRFDAENGGHPLYAPESRMALDASGVGLGDATGSRTSVVPPGGLIPAGGNGIGSALPPGSTNTGPGMGVIRMGGPPKPTDAPATGEIANPAPLGIISPPSRP